MSVQRPTIFIGAGHRGFELKEQMIARLTAAGYVVTDCGAATYDADDDYPDYAKCVAQRVVATESARGIVICGSGVGVCVAANKVPSVRAGLALNAKQVREATAHDHLTVLCLAADYTDPETAWDAVHAFLTTPYSSEERHVRRVKKITR